uniref:Uncharacterized protein n=1 Tax=Nelumbo nucifera TaxID=4432 RepID=A0A822Y5J4_NELNU|nr:TPA_asm: hypothetical protein HUJ06_028760 [Nelumbo nucifera]
MLMEGAGIGKINSRMLGIKKSNSVVIYNHLNLSLLSSHALISSEINYRAQMGLCLVLTEAMWVTWKGWDRFLVCSRDFSPSISSGLKSKLIENDPVDF